MCFQIVVNSSCCNFKDKFENFVHGKHALYLPIQLTYVHMYVHATKAYLSLQVLRLGRKSFFGVRVFAKCFSLFRGHH
jgi:hypothetical protein